MFLIWQRMQFFQFVTWCRAWKKSNNNNLNSIFSFLVALTFFLTLQANQSYLPSKKVLLFWATASHSFQASKWCLESLSNINVCNNFPISLACSRLSESERHAKIFSCSHFLNFADPTFSRPRTSYNIP